MFVSVIKTYKCRNDHLKLYAILKSVIYLQKLYAILKSVKFFKKTRVKMCFKRSDMTKCQIGIRLGSVVS